MDTEYTVESLLRRAGKHEMAARWVAFTESTEWRPVPPHVPSTLTAVDEPSRLVRALIHAAAAARGVYLITPDTSAEEVARRKACLRYELEEVMEAEKEEHA